jgi:hypothetical protein
MCKALRKALNYHPREPTRTYVNFVVAYKAAPKYQVHPDGRVDLSYEKVEMSRTHYDDENRKLYKSLKKKWQNKNANQMTHFEYSSEEDKDGL